MIPVQVGGGIRALDTADKLLSLGVVLMCYLNPPDLRLESDDQSQKKLCLRQGYKKWAQVSLDLISHLQKYL